LIRTAAVLLAAAWLAACGEPRSAEPAYRADNPERLSEWGQLTLGGGALAPAEGTLAYDLNTPLFTDYAHKLRTIWTPAGEAARWRDGDVLDFPVGTVITKTFYYPDGGAADAVRRTAPGTEEGPGGRLALDSVRLVETRLLVRDPDGWRAL